MNYSVSVKWEKVTSRATSSDRSQLLPGIASRGWRLPDDHFVNAFQGSPLEKFSPPYKRTQSRTVQFAPLEAYWGVSGESEHRKGSAKLLLKIPQWEKFSSPLPLLTGSLASGALHSSGTLPVCLAHLLN